MAVSTAGLVLAAAEQAKPPELLNEAEGRQIATSLAITAYQKASAFHH